MSELPTGWVASDLGTVASLEMGQSPSGEATNVVARGLPLVGGAADFKGGEVKPSRYTDQPTKVSLPGDLILCIRATIGKAAVGSASYCLGRGVAGLRPKAYEQALLRYLLAKDAEDLDAAGTGTTFRQVDKTTLSKWPVPLPPLAEQRRIVAKLDALTAHTARARAGLDRIPALADRYRQAVLAREMAGRSDEMRPLSAAIESGLIGLVRSKAEQDNATGVPYIRMQHFGLDGCWNVRGLTRVCASAGEVERYALRDGDVLFNTRNSTELVGKVALCGPSQAGYLYNNNLLRLRFRGGVLPGFAYRYMQSAQFRAHLEDQKSATTSVAALYQGSLYQTPFWVPSTSRQAEIVRRIDRAFVEVDRLNAEAAAARRLLDRLDQAVLAKAFRGELVPQDPADEPASILLDRIRAVRTAAPKAKRAKRTAMA